ncbi:hypothetical protein AMECASPLE_037827, partial [Ameca splendens]
RRNCLRQCELLHQQASGMAPDVERIIQSIGLGDQDTVQLLLDSYNTQYAECFFFNTDAQEKKK